MKVKIYNILVNRIPAIKKHYDEYRKGVGRFRRERAWIYLLWLNVSYYVLRNQKLSREREPFFEKKKVLLNSSESALSKREEPHVVAKRLANYDIVSLDVFDTLVLRPFSKPTDLFHMVGEKLGYLDFERIRIEMEQKAREYKYAKTNSREVTIEEIWEIIEEEVGIPKKKGMEVELETELQYCFANPFMLEVVTELRKYGCKLIIASDMYLKEEHIDRLLECCGYGRFEKYYVSSELGCSKGDGGIFTRIKEEYGSDKKYIHVGDNEYSDQKIAKKHQFDIYPYHNVNMCGMGYRSEDMSIITGSMYRGIINAYLHNGLKEYSKEFEFGFVYGGLFVLGYVGFIHEYKMKHNIDKILFLSRDGDILKQVYEKLYPEEPCEYVYWSRLAGTKMAAKYFKYDYFRRFLYHKVNQNYSIERIFQTMEIEDMLPKLLLEVPALTEKSILSSKNIEDVKVFLMHYWDEVLSHYEEQITAGKKYYEQVLHGCKKVCAVDVGWAGSGATTLNHMVNNIWDLDCEIVGLLAGTNSIYSSEPDSSEPLLYAGKLESYMFSQEHNRDVWKVHNPNKWHNMYWEALLSSNNGSFIRFTHDDETNNIQVITKEETKGNIIPKIQEGVHCFIEKYRKHVGDVKEHPIRISGRDVYSLMILLKDDLKTMELITNTVKENTMNVE